MIYTPKIQKAISFAIKTHETDQKQKRKGKDIPYISHPLTVGLILARAGASEDVIVAGILHDTIEDSIPEQKVTKEMIASEFGENVAVLVDSVTEKNKELSWEDRKKEALEHIAHFSNDSLMLKAADTLNNLSEIVADIEREGDETFKRFNAPKEKILGNYINVAELIIEKWPSNPLAEDLRDIARRLENI